MKPVVIVRVPFPPESVALLEEDFEVHYAPKVDQLDEAIKKYGAETRAVIANGTIGLSGGYIRALPKLEFIHTVGIGFENVDLDTARAKKVIVANNVGTNAFSVAEQAIALILAVYRGIVDGNRDVRKGLWEEVRQPRPLIFGKRVGIIGLGEVGLGVARRVEAFEATVGYHNRKPRDVPYTYYGSALELAKNSDILVISCPGGPETRHMVNADVMEALGPSGIVINVGRGSVVDQDALVEALHKGTIAGAGLDVFQNEPNFTPALAGAPNLTVSPHIGGRSPEAAVFAREQIARNLKAHFFGKGEVVHRVA